MRFWIGFLILLATASVLAAQAPAGGNAQNAPAGDAENGKKLFASYGCYQCHGYVGQGGAAGARLAPTPIPFAAFSRYVRRPTDQMPPYTAKVVSDKELGDIYAYLVSIPKPPAANTITILNR